MKLSELIRRAEMALEEAGDVEVVIQCHNKYLSVYRGTSDAYSDKCVTGGEPLHVFCVETEEYD